MEAVAIRAEHLTKRYRQRLVVDDVSLRIDAGETFGILGTNGAGKTTTVEMIAGLRTPDGGTVEILGMDPRRDRARVREILGVQLQHAMLHHALRAEELVRPYRSFYPKPRSTDDLLELVGLQEQRRIGFDKLSGGQQQRLSIALALAGRPKILTLDELTTGLDPSAPRRMWRTIEQLKTEGVTIILVSHAMEEVERLCDRVALLDTGRVVAIDTPSGLITHTETETLDDAFIALTGKELEES